MRWRTLLINRVGLIKKEKNPSKNWTKKLGSLHKMQKLNCLHKMQKLGSLQILQECIKHSLIYLRTISTVPKLHKETSPNMWYKNSKIWKRVKRGRGIYHLEVLKTICQVVAIHPNCPWITVSRWWVRRWAIKYRLWTMQIKVIDRAWAYCRHKINLTLIKFRAKKMNQSNKSGS